MPIKSKEEERLLLRMKVTGSCGIDPWLALKRRLQTEGGDLNRVFPLLFLVFSRLKLCPLGLETVSE